jgi:hypothetical protein
MWSRVPGDLVPTARRQGVEIIGELEFAGAGPADA